jgi:mRNA interferase MazF
VRRGDVHELPSPRGTAGREQRGRRYAVILQATELLALSTVVVAPTSTSALPASFRPEVDVRGQRTRVLVEQIAAVDPSRLGRRVGRLGADEVPLVDDALRLVLGLG